MENEHESFLWYDGRTTMEVVCVVAAEGLRVIGWRSEGDLREAFWMPAVVEVGGIGVV